LSVEYAEGEERRGVEESGERKERMRVVKEWK